MNKIRYSSIFFTVLAAECAFLALLLLHSAFHVDAREYTQLQNAGLVKELSLTDLCLFTEARYTRHPSQADLNTAFQDHPLSMEHFPSGSFIQPNIPGITQ